VTRLQTGQSGFDSQNRQGIFHLCHCIQNDSVVHPASYPMGTGGMKLTTHLHLVPKIRMHGSICPFPHTSSWYGI